MSNNQVTTSTKQQTGTLSTSAHPFYQFKEAQGELPVKHNDWSDDLRFEYTSLFSDLILNSFDNSQTAVIKVSLMVAYYLETVKRRSFHGNITFDSTKFGAIREEFNINFHLYNEISETVNFEKINEHMVDQEPKDARDRFNTLFVDRDGILSLWNLAINNFPGTTGADVGHICSCLMVLMEISSAYNSEHIHMNLEGLQIPDETRDNGSEGEIMIDRKLWINVIRKEVEPEFIMKTLPKIIN